MKDPIHNFFSSKGSGFFGGITLVFSFFFIYYKNNKLNVLSLLDLIIIAVPIGIIFGRTGCFLAGDGCYGIPTSASWGMTFPRGLMPTLISVHPTQLYEIAINMTIVYIMLKKEHIFKKPGEFFGFYLLLFGFTRFFIEFYRINIDVLYSLSSQQLFSGGFMLIGIFFLRNQRFIKNIAKSIVSTFSNTVK